MFKIKPMPVDCLHQIMVGTILRWGPGAA